MSQNKPQSAEQFRARIEAAHAAASTPTGGSFIRLADGTLVSDPNGVSTQPDAPAGATEAAPAAGVAVVEKIEPPAQGAAKKLR